MTRIGYIGVDGGGTKTHFTLIDDDGTILGEHQAGTTYHLQVGVEGVRAVLEAGLAGLLSIASGKVDRIKHVFFGLPAFGEDRMIDPLLQEIPAALLGHRRYTIGNDMVCGWAGSLACEDGINIVAGTGSIGYGERGGAAARAGGWGELFGDEGSGYWVAVQGLNAFSRMSDGRLPRSALYGAVRDELQLADDIDLCSLTMGDHAMARDQVAGLSRLVTAAAAAGDEQAVAICDRAATELAAIADAIRGALDFAAGEPVPLSYSGGMFSDTSFVLAAFERRAQILCPQFQLRPPQFNPSYGAALYARKCAARR